MALHVDCRLNEKHQQNTYDICAGTYVGEFNDPSLGNIFHVVSHRRLNDDLRYISLTFQQAENLENANMAMGGQRAAGGAWFKIQCMMIWVWVGLRAIEK